MLQPHRPIRLLFWGLLLSATALGAPQSDADPRERILDIAHRYAQMRWTASERHAFHGEDDEGVRIDTPDVGLDPEGWKPGEVNVGMPYCWGGFTSVEGFEQELSNGAWAGHVPLKGNAPGSRRTSGVDCSGYVSRCWELPLKQSTRSLGALCYELPGYDDLLPGDVVNAFDSHVALFLEWEDEERTRMRVLEAARLRVDEGIYTRDQLKARGFRPMRYKPLDPRWVEIPRVVEGARDGPRGFEPSSTQEAPLTLADLAGYLASAEPGEVAHYHAREARLGDTPATCTWLVARRSPSSVELQRALDFQGGRLATGLDQPVGKDVLSVLLAFGAFSDPFRETTWITHSIEAGSYRLGDREFPAQRLTGLVEAKRLSRSTLYPAMLEFEVVFSEEVGVFGICEARMTLELTVSGEGDEAQVAVLENSYELVD